MNNTVQAEGYDIRGKWTLLKVNRWEFFNSLMIIKPNYFDIEIKCPLI